MLDKMTLWQMKKNEKATITDIAENLPSGVKQRLQEIGLNPEENITCVRTSPLKGPKVFQTSDSVFSLEKEVAENIFLKRD